MRIISILSMVLLLAFCMACTKEDPGQAEDGMAEFSKLTSFMEKHDEPRPFDFEARGKTIQLEVAGGEPTSVYEMRPEGKPEACLIVIHEWWGLNDYIKLETEKYFDSLGQTLVLAIDLYDGKVAETREKASEYVRQVTDERSRAIIGSVLDYCKKIDKLGTIGWCFGGAWSLKTSIQAGKQSDACVIYYGTPVKTADELAPLKAPVLGLFGKQDAYINEELIGQFEALTKATGKDFEYIFYDADHAFANPSSTRYHDEAAKEANKVSLAFLRDKLDR